MGFSAWMHECMYYHYVKEDTAPIYFHYSSENIQYSQWEHCKRFRCDNRIIFVVAFVCLLSLRHLFMMLLFDEQMRKHFL